MTTTLKTALLILIGLSLTACAGRRIKPSGMMTTPALLTAASVPNMTADQIDDELARSNRVQYWPYNLYVEAKLHTMAQKHTAIIESVDKEVYKNRWDEKKKQERLKKYKAHAKKSLEKTCFTIKVYTNDMFARKHEQWHGDLLVGDEKPVKVNFTQFIGLVTTTTTTNQYGSSKSKEYTLFTTACSEKKIDITKAFIFHIMPRYKEKIPTIKLGWGIEFPRRATPYTKKY